MPDFSSDVISSSITVIDKKDIGDKHFRWESLIKFLFLANAYSNHIYNFDMYSRVTKSQVMVCEFILWQIIIGMPYMFMDSFIKQYTRRIDGFKFLNPLLRGITFGLLLQTAYMTLTQSEVLADSIRYLLMTFHPEIPWTHCYGESNNSSCLTIDEIVARKRRKEESFMNVTAAHYHYEKQFIAADKSVMTTRCFVIGIVWMLNFFISTVSDEALVKIYYFIFVFRTFSSLVIVILLTLTLNSIPSIAFKEIMSTTSEGDISQVFIQVAYGYGVGFLGFCDFGTMSPYTMLDTAVVMYSVFYTLFSIVRAWIVRVLFLKLYIFVKVEPPYESHYIYFSVLPLSTEFMRAHRLYAIYVYLNFIFTLTGFLTMQTLSMSKLLHTEFRTLKTIYIVGLISCFGFIASVPFALSATVRWYGGQEPNFLSSELAMTGSPEQSPLTRPVGTIIVGISVAVLYLGGFKVAVIMWVYGVEKFSTDIQFWLGFKPTKYWRLCWAIMPIILLIMLSYRIWHVSIYRPLFQQVGTYAWLLATFLFVAIFNIKSITKLLVKSNLASIFTANIRYGPPDPTDRLKRRHYSETIQLRYCKHNCQVIDDLIDCNHRPLISSATGSNASSIESLKHIYKAEGTGMAHTSIRHPSMFDLAHHHF